jgi:hypothetical protein
MEETEGGKKRGRGKSEVEREKDVEVEREMGKAYEGRRRARIMK